MPRTKGGTPTKKLEFSPVKTAEENEEEAASLLGPGTANSIYSHTQTKKKAGKTKKQRVWQLGFAVAICADVGLG